MKLLSALIQGLSATAVYGASHSSEDWSGWGGNIFNNRWASQSSARPFSDTKAIQKHCKLDYEFGVSATPVVSGDTVYYPTWNGLFVAADYASCSVKWQINVTTVVLDYAPITGASTVTKPVSRTSPQIDGDILYFGTLTHALVVAVNRHNGKVLGMKQLNPHPVAVITMGLTVYDGMIMVGASSDEESASESIPGYVCCSFVGNFAALRFDKHAGKFDVAWNASMLPLHTNFTGAAIWGSQPSVDPNRGQVFIATGNIYTYPTKFEKCANANASSSCLPENVLQEAIVAFDIASGKTNWATRLGPLDAWTVSCEPGPRQPGNCPPEPGVDADFGMAPAFVPARQHCASKNDVIVVGQKNGNLYSLSAQTGKLIWATPTSPDGTAGGLSWGVAVDDKRVYFTAINSGMVDWQLQPSNQTVNGSAYGAVDLSDGEIVWQTAVPHESSAYGPPTAVGDLVLVARTQKLNTTAGPRADKGGLVFLSQTTGQIVGDIRLDATFHGGVAVQGEYLMFGTGYNGYNGTGSFYVMRGSAASK